MENFLSLPRFAKSGLAVLLAVALLGWGIVAYSSKRQHEDVKSLQQALATLDSKTETAKAAEVELEGVRARLAAAETDLGERDQADTEAEASTGTSQALGLVGDQGTNVDVATLRERLTTSRTALSARSATLAQRDRELEKTKAAYQAATADIEALEADLVEQDVLRDRLSTVMTTLSSRTATLAQRDHALASLSEEHEITLSKLVAFEANATSREKREQTLGGIQLRVDRTEQALKNGAVELLANQQMIAESEARLREVQTKSDMIVAVVAGKEQEVDEREQDLTELGQKASATEQQLADLVSTLEQQQSEVEKAGNQLAVLKTAQAETEAGIASLTAEFEQQETALSNTEDTLAYTDTRLAKLRNEVAMTEKRITETETLLGQKASKLGDRQQDVKAVEATLSALKDDQAKITTRSVALRNTISGQETVLKDLEAAKDDLQKAGVELSERQDQIRVADNRLNQLQEAVQKGAGRDQTFAEIPIAAISSDNLAVLPIDPIYEPFPIQTAIGIRLTQVHFDLGSAELTPGGLRKAKEAAAWVKTQDVEKIRLIGFTDSIGTRANNRSLARRRATSLLRVFEEQGVDPDRMEIVAKGEVGAQEVTEDHTAEPLNRCVGVFIGAGG